MTPAVAVADGSALQPFRQSCPWRYDELVQFCSWFAVGASLLVASWFGTSGTAEFDTAVGWFVVGIVGVVLAAAACARWLLSGTRAARELQRAVCGRLVGVVGIPPPVVVLQPARGAATLGISGHAQASTAAAPAGLVSAEGMLRYHRSDCLLARGKDVRLEAREEHEASGRVPCGVCGP